MKIQYTQKIELDEKAIEQILINYVNKEFDISIGDAKLKFLIGKRHIGHHLNEHEETYFDGAEITFTKCEKKVIPTRKGDGYLSC